MKIFSILLMVIIMTCLLNPTATTIYTSVTEPLSCSSSGWILEGTFTRVTCAGAAMSQRMSYWSYGREGNRCTLYGTPSSTATTTGISEWSFRPEKTLDKLTNIALNKATTASAYWTSPINLVGDLGVDGNEAGSSSNPSYYHSHPTVSGYPWWVVDLGGNFLVAEVHVLANGDGSHAVHFREVEVRVGETLVTDGDFTSWPLLEFFVGPPTIAGEYVKFSVNIDSALCGRYVSIQKISVTPPNYLVFSEVKVFALG